MSKKVVSIQTVERRKKAVELRRAGLTYAKIGEQLGITRQSSFAHVRAVLTELRCETAEDGAMVKQLELERLDHATALAMSAIAEGNLAGIDRLIKTMERRARLLGLDAPEQIDIAGQQLPTLIIAEPVSPPARE